MTRSFVPKYSGSWPPGPDDTVTPDIPHRAVEYSRAEGRFVVDDDHMLNAIVGAGGVFSTVGDLHRWDQALYTEQMVSQASLDEAFTSGVLNNGESFGYGFGWGLDEHRGNRRISHGGSWVGFRTNIARHPDDGLTVIILTNLSSRNPTSSPTSLPWHSLSRRVKRTSGA